MIMYNRIKLLYLSGRINDEDLNRAVILKFITQEEADSIKALKQ